MHLTRAQAALLEAFIQHTTEGRWPHVLQSFCDETGNTRRDVFEAWNQLATVGGVIQPDPEDFGVQASISER